MGMPAPGKAPRVRKAAAPSGNPYANVYATSTTPSKRQTAFAAGKQAAANLLNQQRQNAAALVAAQATGMAKKPAPGSGACGDGDLHIGFLSVGQGDCTIISTPDGNVVLIDCGSDSMGGVAPAQFLKNLQDTLIDVKYMGPSNQLTILITTHPDTDHYNKLPTVLSAAKITTWYHSADRMAYSAASTSAFLQTAVLGGIGGANRVIFNDDPVGKVKGETTINGSAPTGGGPLSPVLLANGGIRILTEKSGCQITILAAGVDHDYENDTATPDNRGSIVTLIECKGKKVLICGDATRSTERFLLNKAGVNTKIQNVDVVQIGHHASIRTSSLPAFVQAVNPVDTALGSAGLKIPLHRLPSKEVLDRYETQMSTALPKRTPFGPHDVGCWENQGTAAGIQYFKVSYNYVRTTGSEGLIEVTI